MLSAGENPLWVASQMGHSDWGMIRKVYGRWIPEADPQSGGKAILMWAQVGHKDRQSA
jgi:integrase